MLVRSPTQNRTRAPVEDSQGQNTHFNENIRKKKNPTSMQYRRLDKHTKRFKMCERFKILKASRFVYVRQTVSLTFAEKKNHSELFRKQLGLSTEDVNESSRSWGPGEVLTLTMAEVRLLEKL